MQIVIDLTVEEFLMLARPEFDAKIAQIASDVAETKTGVEALIAQEAIPDFVGTAVDGLSAVVTDLKSLVIPPTPTEPTV